MKVNPHNNLVHYKHVKLNENIDMININRRMVLKLRNIT